MQLARVGVDGESVVGIGSRDRDWYTLRLMVSLFVFSPNARGLTRTHLVVRLKSYIVALPSRLLFFTLALAFLACSACPDVAVTQRRHCAGG